MAITGLTEVDATIEEIVSTQIQMVLTAELVIPATISDFSAQVGAGMDLLKIPRFGNFSIANKASGTAVTAQTQTFSTDDLPLDKHPALQVLIEDIADMQAKISVSNAFVEQAGKDMAAKVNLDLATDMEASPSAAAPDHIAAFANATDLSEDDFFEAARLLDVQNVPRSDRFCLIDPASKKALFSNFATVFKANEAGSGSTLRNGEIGDLFGFSVFESSQVTASTALFYHKSTEAFAMQMSPRVEKDRDLPNIADLWSVDQVWGLKALDSGLRIVKVNASGA